jgi:hypothetical protein
MVDLNLRMFRDLIRKGSMCRRRRKNSTGESSISKAEGLPHNTSCYFMHLESFYEDDMLHFLIRSFDILC